MWLKWGLLIVPFCGFLLSAGGMMWQISALTKQVEKLESQLREVDRRTIETGATVNFLAQRKQ
jgi:hypothetical protein